MHLIWRIIYVLRNWDLLIFPIEIEMGILLIIQKILVILSIIQYMGLLNEFYGDLLGEG